MTERKPFHAAIAMTLLRLLPSHVAALVLQHIPGEWQGPATMLLFYRRKARELRQMAKA